MPYVNKTQKWCVADFETKTEKFYLENGYTEVWLYAISDDNGEIMSYGYKIEDFFDYCYKNLNGYIIYFHNLKFDGSFILNYLIKNKYEYKDRVYCKDYKKFSTLISEEGQFYQITVRFDAKHSVVFQDSLKILPFSVKKIATDFELPMLKGSIDYDNYTIDDTTLDYVFNDVKIVALALADVKKNGMLNMTTASCAYSNFISQCMFVNSFFPELDEDFLENWRQAYRGGRTQVNPRYAGCILHNVKRYDINSMYPYIMHDLPLPIGNPIPIKKMGEYKFELYHIWIKFTLKAGHLPTLLKKNAVFDGFTYYEDSEDIIELYISSIDYLIMQRHYDIQYFEIIEMYGFNTTDKLFKKYIDKWYEIKNNNKGAKKQVAKLMLNALYGKFGSRCKGKSKIPYIDEDGVLQFKNTEDLPMKKYYLPIAIAIVSWAHLLIDDGIEDTGINNFVYCDTDSIHTRGELNPSFIHQKQLGKYKLEGVEAISRYVRQKTYMFGELINEDDDCHMEWYITCAGMDDRTKQYAIDKYGDDLINHFEKGFTVEGTKLLPKQVPGGMILCQTSFQIKAD